MEKYSSHELFDSRTATVISFDKQITLPSKLRYCYFAYYDHLRIRPLYKRIENRKKKCGLPLTEKSNGIFFIPARN